MKRLYLLVLIIGLLFITGCGGIGKPPEEAIQKLIDDIYRKGNDPFFAYVTTKPVVTNG